MTKEFKFFLQCNVSLRKLLSATSRVQAYSQHVTCRRTTV